MAVRVVQRLGTLQWLGSNDSKDGDNGGYPAPKTPSAGTVAPGAEVAASMSQANNGFPFPTKDNMQAFDQFFTVVLAADNTPQQCPPFIVPPGCSVRIRAENGQAAGNAAIVFVASYREALLRGMGKPLAPLDDVLNPVDNTCRIWVSGKSGDGVVIGITSRG